MLVLSSIIYNILYRSVVLWGHIVRQNFKIIGPNILIRHKNSYIIDSNCISVNLYAPLDDMKTIYYTILLSWSVVSVTVYRSYFDDFNHRGGRSLCRKSWINPVVTMIC